MKKISFFLAIVMVIFLSSIGTVLGQNDTPPDVPSKNQHIVIGIPKISAKTLPLVTNALENIKGAEYVMFCPKDKLLIIEYDLNIFRSDEDIICAFHRQDIQMKMFIKDAIIEDIIEQCQQETTY